MLRTVAALLLAAVIAAPASARVHAPYRGHRIVPATAAPLDGFTAPSGAYSFRKLLGGYAGPAIRLRRASDNLETDINFLGCTGFTGCPWDEAAASAHCAATTCFARTRYNQGSGGASFDIVQTTAANQPQLIFNCNGSLPCLRTTTNTHLLLSAGSLTPATGTMSFSAVAKRSGALGACVLIRGNGNANRLAPSSTTATWTLVGGTSGTLNGVASETAWHAASAVLNGASSVLNIDGTETAGTVTGSTAAGTVGLVGALGGTTCDQEEEIVWDAYGLTPAERAALRQNQKAYFGTP